MIGPLSLHNYRTVAHLAHTGLWESTPQRAMFHLPEPVRWYLTVAIFPLCSPFVISPYARQAYHRLAESASTPPENQCDEFSYQYHTADRRTRRLELVSVPPPSFSDSLKSICISRSNARARRRRFPVLSLSRLCQELVHESTIASICCPSTG